MRHKLRIPQLWSIHEIIVSLNLCISLPVKSFQNARILHYRLGAVKNHLNATRYFADDAIRVIYNGVDSTHFLNSDCDYLYDEWGIPRNAKIIGMMGRVNSWKGQGDFLQAANILMEKHRDLYTVFVGAAFEGEEWREKELAEKIEKSPYKDRIINKGYRTDSKGIYKLFDVFVLPSTNPDPLPTVVLEAMATGKSVVGYRHGGVCEMVKEDYNGLFADVCNPTDLASKIDILLEDDSLRMQMGENSRKDWLIISLWHHIYSKLFGSI